MNTVSGKRASPFEPVRPEWLGLRCEEAIDPDLPIIDAHHHLWDRPECPYLLPDLQADIARGHNVRATVFVECKARYRREAERSLRSVGETEFAAAAGDESDQAGGLSRNCAGIVAFTDLQVGDEGVGRMLDAHCAVANGRLRGIRNISARLDHSAGVGPTQTQPAGLLLSQAFRRGFAQLASRDLTFDAWMFHTQLAELQDLAEAFPETTIILNHAGGPLGIGRYAGSRKEVFAHWSSAIHGLAALPNVCVKLGGMGMPLFGFGFHEQAVPPSSEQMANAWRPYIETCIHNFGAQRCMFESNFPVDKASYDYTCLWNAFKRVTAGCSLHERELLFAKTAARVYRLGGVDTSSVDHPPGQRRTLPGSVVNG